MKYHKDWRPFIDTMNSMRKISHTHVVCARNIMALEVTDTFVRGKVLRELLNISPEILGKDIVQGFVMFFMKHIDPHRPRDVMDFRNAMSIMKALLSRGDMPRVHVFKKLVEKAEKSTYFRDVLKLSGYFQFVYVAPGTEIVLARAAAQLILEYLKHEEGKRLEQEELPPNITFSTAQKPIESLNPKENQPPIKKGEKQSAVPAVKTTPIPKASKKVITVHRPYRRRGKGNKGNAAHYY